MPLLTKSRYNLAQDCPAKLYYSENAQYANQTLDDPFLKELAKGGFQVGALAKCYHPGGHAIKRSDPFIDCNKTLELLQQENVIIYEACFLVDTYAIYADIIEKKGNQLKLIEVKAKSVNGNGGVFLKEGKVETKWKEVLEDVTYQNWVIKKFLHGNGLHHLTVESYIMLVDKTAVATVNGLNQQFFYDRQKNEVITSAELQADLSILGAPLLVAINVDTEVAIIQNNPLFKSSIDEYAIAVGQNKKIDTQVSKACKKCEFRNKQNDPEKADGFKECWTNMEGLTESDFERSLAFEIWDMRRFEKLQDQGKLFIDQLERSDLEDKPGKSDKPGMSRVDRQEWQVVRHKQKNNTPVFLREAFKKEMDDWVYPFHMIDFETATTALPFYKGMRPYETVAFQFSHHIMHEDGNIEHADEWINAGQGVFPNFEFVRALKLALSKDHGTIFRYAPHENTVLNHIYSQLELSAEPDKKELQEFIAEITYKTDEREAGYRNMVDLCDVVRRYYFNPLAGGSNSIKFILPAILNTSKRLQQKYSKPIYGTENMTSLNFTDCTWVTWENGKLKDPYKLLPTIFSENDEELLDKIFEDDSLNNGGAAMAAYGVLQYTRITETEAEKIRQALLKYCELDTLAMVMIMEEFINL